MMCRKVRERLSPYQDGELRSKEREEVARHLRSCPACGEEYARMQRVWGALGELPEIRPLPGFHAEVVKRINRNCIRQRPGSFHWVWQFFSSPAAASALLIAGVLAGTFLGNTLARNDRFPFAQNRIHAQEAVDVFSLKAFDPVPPGTLGYGYLRMASYGEEGRR